MDAAAVESIRLGLPPEADIWVLPGQGVLVSSPDGLHAFPGKLAIDCTDFLSTGSATPAAVFSHLARAYAPDMLVSAMTAFRDGGLLRERDAGLTVEPPAEPRAGLDAAALSAAGFSVWPGDNHPRPPGATALVPGPLHALPGADLPAAPWCPVQVDAGRIIVGPLFSGTRSDPCLHCLTERAAAHDDLGRLLRAHPAARHVQRARMSLRTLGEDTDFIRQSLQYLPDLPPGSILIRRRKSGDSISARARPRGGCVSCKAPAARLELTLPGQAALREGGYRPLSAGRILPQLEPHVDPVSGIVRDLHALPCAPQARSLSRTLRARHAFPLATPDLETTLRNRQGRSAGKGRDPESIRLGAIAEAMERYAGLARPGDVHEVARADALDGPVILPESWTLFSPEQQAEPERWAALGEPSARIPPRRRDDDLIAWTGVTALDDGTPGWAPSALCWHEFTEPDGCAVTGWADSNGCAAGQEITDARLQGLLELVERDAIGLWWWSRANRPEIGVTALDDPWAEEVGRVLDDLGYRLSLRDLTHDLAVPVVAAVAWPDRDTGPLLMGFGAHPAREVALSRALTELLQALPDRPARVIGGSPLDGLGLRPGAASPALGALDFLRPGTGPAATVVAPRAAPPAPDARSALDRLTRRLAERGLRVWVLDQSRPDVPLPVVRMIAPGLRHFRPRFAPGRLQSVPAELGWDADATFGNPLFIR